jgi:hypothetical protein
MQSLEVVSESREPFALTVAEREAVEEALSGYIAFLERDGTLHADESVAVAELRSMLARRK